MSSKSDTTRNKPHDQISTQQQVQFLWPHPGRPLPGRDAQPAADLDALFNPPIPEGAHKHPPDSFCLLLLRPARVHHLELKASPQRRTLHAWKGEGEGEGEGEGRWVVEPVNP